MSAPVLNAVSGGGTGQRQSWRVRPPPEDGWERFSWIVFISTSLMPDLTSGLKGVGRVRQECGESEHRCACASVSGARTCVPHVVLRCSAVVQAARRSPQVHKSHLSLMCVCDSGAKTCYQSAPVRAAWRRVDGFTRACAQTGSRGGGWGVNRGEEDKAEDGGKRQETKESPMERSDSKKLARVDSHTEAMRSDAFDREELIMKTFSCRSQRSIAFNKGDHLSTASYCHSVTSLFSKPSRSCFSLVSLPFPAPHLSRHLLVIVRFYYLC